MEEAWNRFIAFLSGPSESKPSDPFPPTSYLDEIWKQIKAARRPADQRLGALHFNLLGSFNRFYDLQEMMNAFYEKNWHRDHVMPLDWLKFRQLAEIEINIPNELGLDTRYLAQLPILASVQGQLRWKSKSVSVESDAIAMVTWKLTGEIRTRLPFSGHDVSAGVDVRVAFNAPKNIQLQFNGRLHSKSNLGDQVNDLFYYHVKPYTAIRRTTAWGVPISEDFQSIQIGRPFESQVHLPVSGVNLTLSTYSEHPHNDVNEWMAWINQWNVHSFSKVAFVPLKLHRREYRLRFSPEGTTVSSISTWFQYWKHHHSGSGSFKFESSVPESPNMVPDALKNVLERLFNNLGAGTAHVLDSGLEIRRIDGTRIEYSAILGLARDQSRDQMDLRVSKRFHEHSDDVVLCVSNWRNSDEFQHWEHIDIHFGNNCTERVSRIQLKAKVSADTSRNMPSVQDCRNDLLLNLMGSHVCNVRDSNEIFKTYEVEVDISRKLTKLVLNPLRMLIVRCLNGFVTSYRLESNEADKFILHAVHDPLSESVNLRLLLPKETIVAENIRPTSTNLLTNLIAIVFPMKTGTNVMQQVVSYATAGVSDSKCLVDPVRVVTFDGVAYSHVMNQCNHVLITDCYKNNRFALLARYVEGRPTIQVI